MLCTLADLKTYMGATKADATRDAELTALIAAASMRLARECGRVYAGRSMLELPTGGASWTHTLDVPYARTKRIVLPAWPVASISEAKEAAYGAFASTTALAADEDYQLVAERGELVRVGSWLQGVGTVRVTYRGGYAAPDDATAWVSGSAYSAGDRVSYLGAVYAAQEDIASSTTAPADDESAWSVAAGERPLPEDLQLATWQQAAFWHRRRGELGLTGQGVQGGSYSTYQRDELLPEVRQICAGYRPAMGW